MTNTQRRRAIVAKWTPAEQLAGAYLAVATVDHHMVGVIHPFDYDLWSEAKQILIDQQNAISEKAASLYRCYDIALDMLELDRNEAMRKEAGL